MKFYLTAALGALFCLSPLATTVQARDHDREWGRRHRHDRDYHSHRRDYVYSNGNDVAYSVRGNTHTKYRAAHWGWVNHHKVWIPARVDIVRY